MDPSFLLLPPPPHQKNSNLRFVNMKTFLFSTGCMAFLARSVAAVFVEHDEHDDSSVNNDEEECGVFFARSTIPGAGFGLFAGRDFLEGEELTPGDLLVPYLDMAFHNGVEEQSDINFLWPNYAWNRQSFDYMPQEATYSQAASFGMGAAPNCFPPLINFGDDHIKPGENFPNIDSVGLHRSRDPGVGAFTLYHNRRGVAWNDIPKGMELFLDYGSRYFDKPIYSWMPLQADFPKGDELLKSFVGLRESVLPEIWHDVFDLIHQVRGIWTSRVLNTLPESIDLVDELVNIGVDQRFYNRSIHNIDWLRENGRCMDNIRPGPSSIRQAGRGAFLTRPIKEGQVIAAAPLIQIPNRTIFDMYRAQEGPYPYRSNFKRELPRPYHKQLLLNYCFGHRLLDMLLCPYGVGTALINHSRQHANAKVVWSPKIMAHPEWLKIPPSQWSNASDAGLAFEYVATRDLAEGEEVFIDYSQEWQDAWDEHVETWKPPVGSESYVPDYELNEMSDLVIPIVGEKPPGSTYHELRCREVYRRLWGLKEFDGDDYPCRATQRYEKDGRTVYDVEILIRRDRVQETECLEVVEEVMFGVERGIFVFRDRLYTKDQAQPWSFRHDMRIPDDLIPPEWLNIK